MWKQLYEIANLLFNLGKDLQQNRNDIKLLETEMRDLTETMQNEIRQLKTAIQHLAYEVQRSKENEAHEREKLALRLEVEMLRAVKQLPGTESN